MKNLTYPRFKAFKDDSSPAVGWKAQFYLAGTSTPATTYTDQAGSSANANPVILDGSGEADIWLDPAVSYKLVLKDENDAVQRTVDGILEQTRFHRTSPRAQLHSWFLQLRKWTT
jgi:hypothetical protein